MEREQLFVTNGDVRLALRVAGSGPPALFLHGFPDSSAIWEAQFRVLATKMRIATLDLRGYGQSGRPKAVEAYKIDRLVADIECVVQKLGGHPVALVGHDWGGVIAWAVAASRPDLVRQLIVVNAPHPALLARRIADTPAQAAASSYITRLAAPKSERTLLEGGLDFFWDRVFGSCLAAGQQTLTDRAQALERWSPPGALAAMLNYYRANPLSDLARIGRVDVPTTVIWGMRDTALLPCLLDELAEFARNLRIVRRRNASHWLPYEQPSVIAAELLREPRPR